MRTKVLMYVGMAMVVAALGNTVSAQSPNDKRAIQVLEEARKALGGAKLQAVTGLSAEGAYRRTLPDRELSGELTIALQLPDKFLRTETTRLMGDAVVTREMGVNGEVLLNRSNTSGGGPGMVFRMGNPGGSSPTAEAEMLRAQRADFARYMLAWLLAPSAGSNLTFTHAGEAEADGTKADVLDVKGAGGFEARLFIDAQSHQPLMLSYRGVQPRIVMMTATAPRGGDPQRAAEEARGRAEGQLPPPEMADIQVFYSEYKPVTGVLLPHMISRSVNGQPNEEWTIKKYTVNPTFKTDTFEKK
jgi:hypothetical protein